MNAGWLGFVAMPQNEDQRPYSNEKKDCSAGAHHYYLDILLRFH